MAKRTRTRRLAAILGHKKQAHTNTHTYTHEHTERGIKAGPQPQQQQQLRAGNKSDSDSRKNFMSQNFVKQKQIKNVAYFQAVSANVENCPTVICARASVRAAL